MAGVKSVKLYDPTPVEIKDLGTQFYLCEDDVGKPTAESCKAKLQELNARKTQALKRVAEVRHAAVIFVVPILP